METMPSTPDTLTATGAPVTLAPPAASGATQVGFATGGPDEIVVLTTAQTGVIATGYGVDGAQLFQTYAERNGTYGNVHWHSAGLAGQSGSGVTVAIDEDQGSSYEAAFQFIGTDGAITQSQIIGPTAGTVYYSSAVFASPTGYHAEWVTVANAFDATTSNDVYTRWQEDFGANGNVIAGTLSQTPGAALVPYAATRLGGASLVIEDNQLVTSGADTATLPGEPSHAISEVAAAGLTGGTSAAVAWADSGTDYVSIYDASTNSFGPRIGLDWGGAKDLHTVALADGGFAVSWSNGGAYKGELFAADGTGGGVLALTGQFVALDSHGELYTVGLDSNGAYVVQTYAVNGAGGGTGGTGGSTGGGGATYTSDNAGDHWTGTAADETFNLGRGGDVVTGGGGNDTFKFAETPWAGAHITDFNSGDRIDLTGLLAASGYSGADPVGAGYLKITTDGQGNGQIWSDLNQPGNSGWWLVTTVDGVSGYDLQLQNGVVTHAPGAGPDGTVSTSDPNYQAPAGVTKIILTGSHQTVTGNNAGDTFVSDNTSNHLIGGSGNDTFDLGRDGDIVTGGAGADTFVYQETPWAGGRINDFSVSQGDRIDLNALLAHAGYSGGDPIGDGYIKILDTTGAAQIWADADGPGSGSGWWLVDSLKDVSAGVISLSGGMITGGGDGSVIVEDKSYTASRTAVTSITAAGSSPQQIVGNDLSNTFHDNNNANAFYGLDGDDTFILGLGGSTVSTGSGADTVVVTGVPSSHESITGYTVGADRIDLRGLLSAIGSTGSDPFHDGHLQMFAVSDSSGQYTEIEAHDAAHGVWVDVVHIYNATPSQLHYADGWLS
jgi:hypothetical protein